MELFMHANADLVNTDIVKPEKDGLEVVMAMSRILERTVAGASSDFWAETFRVGAQKSWGPTKFSPASSEPGDAVERPIARWAGIANTAWPWTTATECKTWRPGFKL